MTDTVQSESLNYPKIRRGSVSSLSLYELTDYELDVLEQGSPAGLFLNFSIFLISIGISLGVTVTTTSITDDRLFMFYTIISIVGLVLGILLLGLWYRTRRSVFGVCTKIRGRILQHDIETPVLDDCSNQ
jgi:hypothetical protein